MAKSHATWHQFHKTSFFFNGFTTLCYVKEKNVRYFLFLLTTYLGTLIIMDVSPIKKLLIESKLKQNLLGILN